MSRQSAALRSTTQEGNECLNTRFPLPSLLYAAAEYSVELIYYIYYSVTCYILQNFPWAQRPVSVLNEQALLKMARHPAVVLFVGKYLLYACILNYLNIL